MAAPVQLAAIDAGSNAIRLSIARATSPHSLRVLDSERAAVRLGHHAFTRRRIEDETISRAVRAFRYFRESMDRYDVKTCRAVATAAAREARNCHQLIERIRRKTGIELEVIGSEEEARLVCAGVRWALGGMVRPRLIFDLGGGSLELSFFRRGALEKRVGLPLGTIRLMETYSISGAIDEDSAHRLRHHIRSIFQSVMPVPPSLSHAAVVACGGNAEALARIAGGPMFGGTPTINVHRLREQAWRILELDVPGRMRAYRVRQDRAEVLGIAAIVITTLAKWFDLRSMLVPGVGVREGILLGLISQQYSAEIESEEQRVLAGKLVEGARWFGRRFAYDAVHAEQVANVALSLFDQLRPLHGLGPNQRVMLHVAALLHDVGHFVSRKSHHRHGEYLIRHGELPALRGWRRDMAASLVRYHNSKSEPDAAHPSYAALNSEGRRASRVLASLLQIAEKLESEHATRAPDVPEVEVHVAGRRAIFAVRAAPDARLDIAGLQRKAELFEQEFHLTPVFRRAQRKEKVA
ncbi:MAG TPA: HD domain-containing protein [Candidatus Acidoferrales bacterium]|nr:HD domain-containing protein [Candidatus Acidoferrales bacterium]